MTTTFKLLRAGASGNVPSSLASGQLAIDEFTGKLFWHQNSGTVTAMPLLAPANTVLANLSGSTAAPTYVTGQSALSAFGGAPIASPVFTGSISTPSLICTGSKIDTSYNIATPVVAVIVTIAPTTSVQILNPVGTLTLMTIVFPASPVDGQRFEVLTTQTISSLTCSASGTTIKNAPTSLAAGAGFAYIASVVSGATTWFRVR